jgi:CRISPR-associated protein Csd1
VLAALIRQAQHAGLVVEPGFAPKEIRWMVQISDGRVTGVLPLSDGKKGKVYTQCPDLSHPEMMGLPKILGEGKLQAAHFLADTCGVVALLPALDREGQPKTDPASVAEHAKAKDKHAAFLELLTRAAQRVPELSSVVTVLSDPEKLEQLRAKLIRQKAKPDDKLSFTVDELDLLQSSIWHEWWRSFRRESFGDRKSRTQGSLLDLTNGLPTKPAKTHLKLTKLSDVGAISMGAPLSGYDKPAFESYGLSQGENGAVSEENAAAYRAALDDLLGKAPILGQMKVAAWFDHRQAEGQALIAAIEDPATLAEAAGDFSWDAWDDTEEISISQTPEQQEAVAKERARQLLSAIRQGKEPPPVTAHYFALAMSGASGRAMVRDWKTGSLESLAEAVAAWFDDLAIVNLSGRHANRPKFKTLLMSLQRPKSDKQKEEDYLKPIRNLQLPLWRAAIDPNAPIPLAAVAKVMEAHKAHVMTGKFTEALSREGAGEERGRVYTRMALLRAYHVRKARSQGGRPMSSAVDSNHPSPAYHCGRLMYLLANVQAAQGDDINAGVVQRYYGAASSTPALVLGRLTRLSQHHLAKIARDKPGLAFALEREIASVWAVLGKSLPKTLSLEEQSLFALGYYQQLADSVASRKEISAQRKAEADAKANAAPLFTPEGDQA